MNFRIVTSLYISLPGLETGAPSPHGPNSFIFMQFLAKNLQNNRLAHPLWKLVSSQENPGCATGVDANLWPIF